MKIAIAALLTIIGVVSADAQGLYNSNRGNSYGGSNYGLSGTGSNPSSHYVQPRYNAYGGSSSGHYQSNPNNTQLDNWSTRGNVNPYTGAAGTRSPKY